MFGVPHRHDGPAPYVKCKRCFTAQSSTGVTTQYPSANGLGSIVSRKTPKVSNGYLTADAFDHFLGGLLRFASLTHNGTVNFFSCALISEIFMTFQCFHRRINTIRFVKANKSVLKLNNSVFI